MTKFVYLEIDGIQQVNVNGSLKGFTVFSFNDIWENIISNEGNKFYTITGIEFIYKITGNILETSRTNRKIHKNCFETAFNISPLSKPSDLKKTSVQGSSYVYAILTDNRIKNGID